jgi:flagellar motor component MotA
MMTNEQIEAELKHLATKEDLEKALKEQLKWIILLHVPTWVGMLGTLVGVIAMLAKFGH